MAYHSVRQSLTATRSWKEISHRAGSPGAIRSMPWAGDERTGKKLLRQLEVSAGGDWIAGPIPTGLDILQNATYLRPMSLYRLEELNSPQLSDLAAANAVVILPISPLEEHGPHLPLGTDAMHASHFAGLAAEVVAGLEPETPVVIAH